MLDDAIELIAQHASNARSVVEALDDYCQQDQNGATPFNVAVQTKNRDVIALLAESESAINYCPSLVDDLATPAKYSVAAMFSGTNVEETETYLQQSFGPHICMQRTPLHIACRLGDSETIELLISKKAALDVIDLLGLTPLELCIACGGADAAERFIRSAVDRGRTLAVTKSALQSACPDPEVYDKLLQSGALDSKAKRFAFCLACALLDKDTVSRWLEQDPDLSNSTNDDCNPGLEVCTSRSLSFYNHPNAPRLAAQYLSKQPQSSIHVDNDAIMNAESLEDIASLFDEASAQPSFELPDEERRSQLSRRLELIELLARYGLNSGVARDDIEILETPELLDALSENGFFSTKKATKKKRTKAIRGSRFSWELGGESMLLAQTDPKQPAAKRPFVVRLTHNNVYGPVDGVTLAIRADGNWQTLELVEELLLVDGNDVDRSNLSEPIYDETPWDATYECELQLDSGEHVIAIKLDSDIDGLSGEISDWTVTVT